MKYTTRWNNAIAKNKKTQRGGITLTVILAGANMRITDIIASADGDTASGNIAHGLVTTPLLAWGQQLISQALTALSAWSITTIDATNIVATKLASTGSGNVGAQYRICAWRPHTLVT